MNNYIRQSNLVSGDGLGAPDSNSAAVPDEPYTTAFNHYRIVWDDKLKSGKDVWTVRLASCSMMKLCDG
jgi:hypothetical protein